MPIGKLKMPTRSEVVGEDCANVPKMELMKVNYVYQCKNAIMHRSNESPLPARENNATCFGGYRHQLGKLSQTSHSHQTGRSLSPSSFRTPLAYLKPPIVDSWELLLQPTQKRGFKPILKPEETKMINFTLSQTDSHSAEFFKNLNTFSMESSPNTDDFKNSQSSKNQSHPLTAVSGIKSRADRIARIENRECNFHIKPDSRIAKLSSVPEWMFKNAGTGDDSGLSKCSNNLSAEPPEQYFLLQHKAKLKHVQKKRQPVLMTNRLRHKKERPTKPSGLPQTNYCDESYDYKLCSMPQSEEGQNKGNCKDKRLSVKSCSDSGVSLSKDCSQQSKTIYNGKRANFENIEKHDLVKKFEELNDSIQIKPHGDPNDLQNFSKKDLNKATTNELLIAAAENTKKCNIEMERRLNNLKVRGKEPTFDECWDRETGSPYDDYEKGNIPLSPTPKISSLTFVKPYNKNSELVFTNGNFSELSGLSKSSRSTTSLSLSGCSKCFLDNSSVCSSEEDCCECNDQKYSTTPIDYLSNDCYNAIEGVYWNNAYDDIPPVDITPSCCCSLSCCDEDDCSFFDENLCVEIKSVPAHQPEDCGVAEYLTRNKMIPLKKYAENDLRPRSNDDTNLPASKSISPVPKTSEQIQNQVIDVLKMEADKNDNESRRLKRGHVLQELLETERIYVNEMSSILKGYCDRMKSEGLVPASLQGNEDVLFGNLNELYTFHNHVFLKDLENCISTTELVAFCFVQRRDTFYQLYSFYCQNIPRSERLRETLVDTHIFFQECQKRLGHKLPLAAYLLKPVQRITKYQLLLKDLLRFSDSGSCTKELQKALECMLIVLKCVNDSMHQVAITGFPTDIAQQGKLLLQNSFQVWTDSKKDIRLRIKPQQRHIFLYQKSMLFCKQTSKPGHNKSTYQFKNHVKMLQIGLTESVRGDTKRFEVWLKGRQEVYTLQAPTIDVKQKWVAEIKRVLLNQLEELKGEKIKQYSLSHQGLRQTTSWDTPNVIVCPPSRSISFEASSETSNLKSNGSIDNNSRFTSINNNVNGDLDKDQQEKCSCSSDCSNSEDELSLMDENISAGSTFLAIANYSATGHSEVSMREGDTIELLKVGCDGWWYIRALDTCAEGWAPAAYMEPINRKS